MITRNYYTVRSDDVKVLKSSWNFTKTQTTTPGNNIYTLLTTLTAFTSFISSKFQTLFFPYTNSHITLGAPVGKSNKRLQHGNQVKFVNTKQLSVRFWIKKQTFLTFWRFPVSKHCERQQQRTSLSSLKEFGSDVIWNRPWSTNPDIPSQTAIPRSICAHARI